jgi:tRNA threonylcarbamoyladenosine biosynthesis protein TsaB
MLILAIDTSGKNGGIALARGDSQNCDVIATSELAHGTYSALLIPQVDELLRARGIKLAEIDGFAVAAGPGSFTGLRVGLATVKGLAEIVDRPIAAVSVLECVAALALPMLAVFPARRLVFSAIDAGRSEVFVGEYRVEPAGLQLQQEMILPSAGLVAHVRGQEQSGAGMVATPDNVVLDALKAGGMPAMKTAHPVASDVARIGLRKLAAGEVTPSATLDANYIRRSDAEIFAKPTGTPTTETQRHRE